VPTGIAQSERNRPATLATDAPATASQRVAQAMSDQAVSRGKVSAAEVVERVFDAMAQRQFYVYSHPQALGTVQVRLEDVMLGRNPSDPFAGKPALREQLIAALHG
jgi:hypothetical protein